MILDIAAGKHAFDVGERPVMGHEVTVVIGRELTSEQIGIGTVANGDEYARDGKRSLFASHGVGEGDSFNRLITLNGGHC
ncbi:unannotated protein [freshwater metagenome]|uniref:Unannotated protein n=1 Tax=freshwater metagenome TaxID=449393 RepID=A0A6J7MXX4_9ZZZZ